MTRRVYGARCGKPECGEVFLDGASLASVGAENRPPCPRCGHHAVELVVELPSGIDMDGSVARPTPELVLEIFDSDFGQLSESAYVDGTGHDGSEVIRVERGGADARRATAERDADGRLNDRIVGRASPKALVELRAASLFVQRMNRDGGRWKPPIVVDAHSNVEAGIDCIAESDSGEILNMQVTTVERQAWAELAHRPDISRASDDVGRAVVALRVAVEAKSKIDGRGAITLLIDASDSPAAALRSVVAEFRRDFGTWAAGQGNQAIWVVGPVVDLVNRLDFD